MTTIPSAVLRSCFNCHQKRDIEEMIFCRSCGDYSCEKCTCNCNTPSNRISEDSDDARCFNCNAGHHKEEMSFCVICQGHLCSQCSCNCSAIGTRWLVPGVVKTWRDLIIRINSQFQDRGLSLVRSAQVARAFDIVDSFTGAVIDEGIPPLELLAVEGELRAEAYFAQSGH